MIRNNKITVLKLLVSICLVCLTVVSVQAVEIEMCGLLVASQDDCLVFVPDSLGIPLELDNYGTFEALEHVKVVGILQMDSVINCPMAVGRIEHNTITYCSNSPSYYGCGQLVEIDQCLLYQPFDSPSEFWELDDYGLFSAPDIICLSGDLSATGDSSCAAATGFVVNTVIDSAQSEYQISACGVLMQDGECLLFVPQMGPTSPSFVLTYYSWFGPGDTVCVDGLVVTDCGIPCPGADACIEVWTISPSAPLGNSFNDCGVLVQGSECVLFEPGMMPGEYLVLDNYDGFQVGDSVYASGFLLPDSSLSCPDAMGYLTDNTIDAGCLPFGLFFMSEGVLVDTADCILFSPFETLGELYLLDSYLGFQAGDTVLVNGILDNYCQTTCSAAIGCVHYNIIIPLSLALPGELLIKMQPGYPIEPILSEFGGTIIDVLLSPNTYLADFPDSLTASELAMELLSRNGVVVVHPNYVLNVPESHQMSISFPDESAPIYVCGYSPEPYYDQDGNLSTGLDSAQLLGEGNLITVAVIDNGIDAGHPLFESAILEPGYDFIDNDSDPSEVPGSFLGHGTFVAGLISLAAPQCRILPLRALNSEGFGSAFTVADAIYYAIDQQVDVINMSFGMHAQDATIATAINDAYAAGIVLVASVGNEATTQETYPAAFAQVMAVSAIDDTEAAASFSNGGTYIDISAPGVNVYGPLVGNYDWGTWSGTSFSSPLVAGACALLLGRNPDLTPDEVLETMRLSARADLVSGLLTVPDTYLGYGCLGAFSAGLAWSRGDWDNSGAVDVTDLTNLVEYLYIGADGPVVSLRIADLDCDGLVRVSDLVFLADYLFGAGAAPWPCYED